MAACDMGKWDGMVTRRDTHRVDLLDQGFDNLLRRRVRVAATQCDDVTLARSLLLASRRRAVLFIAGRFRCAMLRRHRLG